MAGNNVTGKKIEIIVSRYSAATGRIYGGTLRSQVYCEHSDLEMFELQACRSADHWCKPGYAVIVRPAYNDGPNKFHEFRSIDGEPLKRVEFV